MRAYLRSDVSTALSTGDEKYKLKFRFTEQEGNIEEYHIHLSHEKIQPSL